MGLELHFLTITHAYCAGDIVRGKDFALSQEIGLIFLNVENHPQKGSRIGLSYILRRTN